MKNDDRSRLRQKLNQLSQRTWVGPGLSAVPGAVDAFRALSESERREVLTRVAASRGRKGRTSELVVALSWHRGRVRVEVVNCESLLARQPDICITVLVRETALRAAWFSHRLPRLHPLHISYEAAALLYYVGHMVAAAELADLLKQGARRKGWRRASHHLEEPHHHPAWVAGAGSDEPRSFIQRNEGAAASKRGAQRK